MRVFAVTNLLVLAAGVLAVRIKDVTNTHGEGCVGPRQFKVVVGETTCKE